jgi:hypothetical protein
VVRPDEKRKKKLEKRKQDPSRGSYRAILAFNNGKHEADIETHSSYELENRISPDEEAHRVAAAIGLPASFDPTIKPIDLDKLMPRHSAPTILSPDALGTSASRPGPPRRSSSPLSRPSVNESGDEESGDEDEDEFEVEVVAGDGALQSQQKVRLHEMEVGEAAALLKSGVRNRVADGDEEDEDEDSGAEAGKT